MKNLKTKEIIILVLILFFLLFLISKFFGFFVFVLGIVLFAIGYRSDKRNIRKNKKRTTSKILIAVGIIIAFSGCSNMIGNNKENTQSTSEQVKTENVQADDEEAKTLTPVMPERKKEEKRNVKLLKVVDGDTIKVLYNGKEETLHYLLIDTPNTKSSCTQPYAKDATERNEELVLGKTLQIKFEQDHKKRDADGDLIAYVFADDLLVQKKLLDEGYALLTAVDNVSYEYLDLFTKAQQNAQKQKLNVWSKENYVQNNTFKKCKPVKKEQTKQEQTSSDDDGHNNSNTQQTQNAPAQEPAPAQPIYFSNCTELRATYPNGVPSDHAAYQPKMDRDKDGTACEQY